MMERPLGVADTVMRLLSSVMPINKTIVTYQTRVRTRNDMGTRDARQTYRLLPIISVGLGNSNGRFI